MGRKEVEKGCKLSKVIAYTAVLLVAVAIAFASLAVAPVMAQEDVVTVTVNAPESVEKGESFDVTIVVDSITELTMALFDISFNHEVVEVKDVEGGSIAGEEIPVYMSDFVNEETMRVMVMVPDDKLLEGVSGSGYLAKMNFKVAGEEGDECVLDICPYIFSMDLELEGDLNKGTVPKRLWNMFETNGILLSENLKDITITRKNGDKWEISDWEKKRGYIVRKYEGELNVYDEKSGFLSDAMAEEILAEWIDATIKIGGEKDDEDKEQPPGITALKPTEEAVNSTEGEPITFEISVDQEVDINWQINGTEVQVDEGVTKAAYTNTSAVAGTWNVSAIATNTETGLATIHSWIWVVTPASTEASEGTPTPTPTLTSGVTPTPTPKATSSPGQTVKSTPTVKPTSTPKSKETTPTPTPKTPGFEAIFAIAAMSAIAYVLRRRR